MKRCTIVIPDAGPLISLWVADRLDVLLLLNMPIIVVDAVFDEVTGDTSYQQDADIKTFIDEHRPPFVIEETNIGTIARERRSANQMPVKHSGELAIMQFISEEGGVQRHLSRGDPLLILFEDRKLRVLQRPPNMHLLSTIGLLRGMERSGLISSADDIIREMTHPTAEGRGPQYIRGFMDLPEGTDEPAETGSFWQS